MYMKTIRNTGFTLLIIAMSFLAWMPAHAEEMSCPEHTPVLIDIKPGSDPNTINLSSKGLLPVAVFSTPDFDAALFSPEMAHLSDADIAMTEACAGAMAVRWALEDVNKDGRTDRVFFFRIQDLNLTPTSIAASFMAHGDYAGETIHVIATDTVRAIPK